MWVGTEFYALKVVMVTSNASEVHSDRIILSCIYYTPISTGIPPSVCVAVTVLLLRQSHRCVSSSHLWNQKMQLQSVQLTPSVKTDAHQHGLLALLTLLIVTWSKAYQVVPNWSPLPTLLVAYAIAHSLVVLL